MKNKIKNLLLQTKNSIDTHSKKILMFTVLAMFILSSYSFIFMTKSKANKEKVTSEIKSLRILAKKIGYLNKVDEFYAQNLNSNVLNTLEINKIDTVDILLSGPIEPPKIQISKIQKEAKIEDFPKVPSPDYKIDSLKELEDRLSKIKDTVKPTKRESKILVTRKSIENEETN